MFRRFGSDVTIVEAGPRIAGRKDPDVSEALTGILAEDGITVRTGAEAIRVRPSEGGAAGEAGAAAGAAGGAGAGAGIAGVELVVEDQILGDGARTTADRVLTYAVFTDPQLGRVGLTETQARDEGYDVRVARLPMSRVARAVEMDETRGLMKAVVDAGSGRILGAAVLGVEGGEIASALKVAMMGVSPTRRSGTRCSPTPR